MGHSTIYHAAGITDPCAGLYAAARRANAALRRARATTPDQIPSPPKETRPDSVEKGNTRFGYSAGYGGTGEDGYYVAARRSAAENWTGGSIENYILSYTAPADLLWLTEQAEAIAAQCEAIADRHEAAVRQLIANSVANVRPAIDALARRADAIRLEKEIEELRERVAVLELESAEQD